VFLSGLKGEIKPFAMTFKSYTLGAALEYAWYMESVIDCQFRKQKNTIRFTPNTSSAHYKSTNDRTYSSFTTPAKSNLFANVTKQPLIELRKAHGQCFKCGERYFSGHQCKVKLQMLMGQSKLDEERCYREEDAAKEKLIELHTEEVMVSMHATSNTQVNNTMKFKGTIS
jgi:hypothetical protein